MEKVGVALVGTGFMARTHLGAYAHLERAHVRYVVGTSEEKAAGLAAEAGARAVDALAPALVDPSVDVVDITAPTPLHAELAVRALEAGKHVIVEKPIALDLLGASRMIDARNASGKQLLVAQVMRFWPEYEQIGELLENGSLGAPLTARTYRLSSPPKWAAWLSDPAKTGGAAVDLGIHDFDILNHYFGQPHSVHAWGQAHTAGGWHSFEARIGYGHVTATAEASMAMPDGYPFTAGIEIRCEEGVIEYRFRAGGASFEEGEPENRLLLFQDGSGAKRLEVAQRDPFESQLEEFLKCVAEDRASSVLSAEDARSALQVALGINSALDLGRRVELTAAPRT